MSARPVIAAADVIRAEMERGREVPEAFAVALESAQLLMSPEVAAELERLRARVTELEAERNAGPNRFTAAPAEVDAHLRKILAEDTYLRFQQTIGEHAIAQTVEDTDVVRAGADNEGLYNNDWREGWDDFRDRVDPDQNGPYPSKLIEFPVAGPSVEESADRLTRLIAPTQAYREEAAVEPWLGCERCRGEKATEYLKNGGLRAGCPACGLDNDGACATCRHQHDAGAVCGTLIATGGMYARRCQCTGPKSGGAR